MRNAVSNAEIRVSTSGFSNHALRWRSRRWIASTLARCRCASRWRKSKSPLVGRGLLTGTRFEPIRAEARPGELHRIVVDPAKAGEVLGWSPVTELDEGLKHTVAWFEGWGGDGGQVRIDYRPVHEYTLTDDIQYIKPKARTY